MVKSFNLRAYDSKKALQVTQLDLGEEFVLNSNELFNTLGEIQLLDLVSNVIGRLEELGLASKISKKSLQEVVILTDNIKQINLALSLKMKVSKLEDIVDAGPLFILDPENSRSCKTVAGSICTYVLSWKVRPDNEKYNRLGNAFLHNKVLQLNPDSFLISRTSISPNDFSNLE